MEKRIYTSITEETLTAARDRVLDDLNALTDGNADKAIQYAAEFKELDGILEEHRQREREQAEAAAAYERLRAEQNKEFSELAEVLEKEMAEKSTC